MIHILGIFPLSGNGGIASWTKKFLATFPDEKYHITAISNSSGPRTGDESKIYRAVSGCFALCRIKKDVRNAIKKEQFDIMHTTTSGNMGSLRDYSLAKLCRRHGIRTIMHCRYGCISEDYHSNGLIGFLLRRAMNAFDQIWVLDTRSYMTLKAIDSLKDKVHLTPNSIEVTEPIDFTPKNYSRVAFIGNLLPTKGLYELVEACIKSDVRLDLIGPGSADVVNRVKDIAGDSLNTHIFIHGKLPNEDAVRYMHEVDIVALPTYYQFEAFPISILEAMSLTKMVISCPRAAISDMLTGLNGKPCGMLVTPRSSEEIANAISWCQMNKLEADEMCRWAYEKVYNSYRKEVVYDLYRSYYQKLIS